jgi:hypothetical protein
VRANTAREIAAIVVRCCRDGSLLARNLRMSTKAARREGGARKPALIDWVAADEVLQAAEELAAKEQEMLAAIQAGRSILEVDTAANYEGMLQEAPGR